MICTGDYNEFRREHNTVIDFTCNGECSRCGSCCTEELPITEKELRRIKAYVTKNHIKPYRRLFADMHTIDRTCPFYNPEKKVCMIYKARPKICQDFICSGFNMIEWIKKSKNPFEYKRVYLRDVVEEWDYE